MGAPRMLGMLGIPPAARGWFNGKEGADWTRSGSDWIWIGSRLYLDWIWIGSGSNLDWIGSRLYWISIELDLDCIGSGLYWIWIGSELDWFLIVSELDWIWIVSELDWIWIVYELDWIWTGLDWIWTGLDSDLIGLIHFISSGPSTDATGHRRSAYRPIAGDLDAAGEKRRLTHDDGHIGRRLHVEIRIGPVEFALADQSPVHSTCNQIQK